jgi:hypothetical protein
MSSSRTPSCDPRNRQQIAGDVARRWGEPDFTAATQSLFLRYVRVENPLREEGVRFLCRVVLLSGRDDLSAPFCGGR